MVPQVRKMKDGFVIKSMVLVGDRGMISQKRTDEIKEFNGVDWITALKLERMKNFMEGEVMRKDLFETTHPDFSGERLSPV